MVVYSFSRCSYRSRSTMIMVDLFLPELWPISGSFTDFAQICSTYCISLKVGIYIFSVSSFKKIKFHCGSRWQIFARVMAHILVRNLIFQMFLRYDLPDFIESWHVASVLVVTDQFWLWFRLTIFCQNSAHIFVINSICHFQICSTRFHCKIANDFSCKIMKIANYFSTSSYRSSSYFNGFPWQITAS